MGLTVLDLEEGTIPIVGGVAGYELAVKEVTFDSSYPTGGEPLTAADLGLASVLWCVVHAADGYVFEYDYANSKIIAYWVDTTVDGAAMAQVANTTDLSAVVTRVIAIGTPA